MKHSNERVDMLLLISTHPSHFQNHKEPNRHYHFAAHFRLLGHDGGSGFDSDAAVTVPHKYHKISSRLPAQKSQRLVCNEM